MRVCEKLRESHQCVGVGSPDQLRTGTLGSMSVGAAL